MARSRVPATGKTFRVVANKYQAWIFQPAASGNRSFVAFGTPYLPTFLQGVITEFGWLIGNALNDSTAAIYPNFRTGFCHTTSSTQNDANTQTIVNTNLLDVGASANSHPLRRSSSERRSFRAEYPVGRQECTGMTARLSWWSR
ncbi:MAG: hypothetical protein M3N93_15575 [Acidobacteriota bacterium]|nr:hypothetical protein [Acidobacteriota bacterium]